MCDEKYDKSRKTPLFEVKLNAEVTGFNGRVTAAAVNLGPEVAKVTGGTICVPFRSLYWCNVQSSQEAFLHGEK